MVLKFAINAGLNTLPTFDNLKRWGKRVCNRCPFCGNIQTLAHVLSNCSVALDQGRLTWRHNSVLSSIVSFIRPILIEGFSLYADLDGLNAPHGGVIPPHILATNLKPDLFLFNEVSKVAVILELTCPWDSNITRSHEFKREKYAPLVGDLSLTFTVFYFPIEVSVRGQVSKGNRARLKAFLFRCCQNPRKLNSTIIKICSRASLLSSFSIFCARKEPSWNSPALLTVC